MSPTPFKRVLRYSICVSGAASGETVRESYQKALELGRAIAKSGQILTTGATLGLPYYAAYGAKEAGGMSVGSRRRPRCESTCTNTACRMIVMILLILPDFITSAGIYIWFNPVTPL